MFKIKQRLSLHFRRSVFDLLHSIVIPTETLKEVFFRIFLVQAAKANGARPSRRNDGRMLVVEISREGVSKCFKKCHKLNMVNAL